MQQAVISPNETFRLDAIYGETLGESYSTLEVYDNWGTKIRDYLSYEPQGSETIELGQFEYTYAYDWDTATDNTGAASKLRGVYGSDVDLTGTTFVGGTRGAAEDGMSGNTSNSTFSETASGGTTFTISVGAGVVSQTAQVIGQFDGKDIYEQAADAGYMYIVEKDIDTTVGQWEPQPATAHLKISVESSTQLTLDRVKEIFGSITYIDPQTVALTFHYRPFSSSDLDTQTTISSRAGVEVTIDDPSEDGRAWYVTYNGNKHIYYDKVSTLTFTVYKGFYFQGDRPLSISINNVGEEPAYVVSNEITVYEAAGERTTELQPGRHIYFPTTDTISGEWDYIKVATDPNDIDGTLIEEIDTTQTLTEDLDIEVTPTPEPPEEPGE